MSLSFTDSLSRQVQFFTGKGGVGKSTVLGAVALAAARQGQAPLIVELGEHAGPLPGFDYQHLDYAPTSIAPGVHATRISFQPALLDYMTSRLRLRPLASAVAGNQALRRLFLAAPGVDELVVLHRIAMLAAEERWHPILVDLESSGHALMFFDLPGVMSSILADGPVRRIVESASTLVRDEGRCVVHLVTAPEDLIVSETTSLYRSLLERDDLHLGSLFINRIPAASFDENEAALIRGHLHGEISAQSWYADVAFAAYLIERQRRADRCLSTLRQEIPLSRVELGLEAAGALEAGGVLEALAERINEAALP